MAIRLYLLPTTGSGNGRSDAIRPAYSDDAAARTAIMFGAEAWCLSALDVTDVQHLLITAQPDAYAIPDDLDAAIRAGALTAVTTWLESRNLPAEWVTDAITWRTLLRVVLGIFQFAQRYQALSADVGTTQRLFPSGVTLATRVNELPVAARNRLSTAATELGLDTSGITGTTTLRAVLRTLGQQYSDRAFAIGDFVI